MRQPDRDLDVIRKRDEWVWREFAEKRIYLAPAEQDRHALLEYISELELILQRQKDTWGVFEAAHNRLRAAAQEVVDEAQMRGYLKLKVFGEPYRALAAALEEPTTPLSREA